MVEVDVQNSLTEERAGDQLEVYDTFRSAAAAQRREDERTRQALVSGRWE